MLRTRLLWFGIGFSVSSAAISQFVWRDLLSHRYALSSDMKRKFDDLEGRILNLESVPYHNSNPTTQNKSGAYKRSSLVSEFRKNTRLFRCSWFF
ncbi:hypothetical protein FNV43_RR06087 [Rhamnella rubrinervis]|uniref:Uncharacterized protein n=1 Tax=Rhamnella rubrinervis TaxID=2594499 RepID=A0A8K0MLF8_9ROSA|nr:hypothetical protein FNV43_RR06087 [Rhamnella rubrinervis]